MNNTTQDFKLSEHFNGKKFINPTLKEQFSPGFSALIKMMREGRPDWPKNVKIKAIPQLNTILKEGEFSITFVNHATFLIQTPTLNILTDPVWSMRTSPLSWIGPKRVLNPGVQLDSLPNIDVILISHNHYDHLDAKTMKILNKQHNPLVLVPLGVKSLVESFGFKNVKAVDWWDSFNINSTTTITFTPQQHFSGRGLFDRNRTLWGSYYIQLKERSIYFGGDGGYSTHFSEIKNRLGSPEVALLGIGAYKPDYFMQPIHTSPSEAVQAHQDLGAKQSIGMHYGTFQLASESYKEPKKELIKAMKKEQLSGNDFILLLEGETKVYPKK